MELITAVVVAIMAVWPQPVVFIDYGHPHPSPLSIVCMRILQPIFPFI